MFRSLKFAVSALGVVIIAACGPASAPPEGNAPPTPDSLSLPYNAIGTEPFWSLTIDGATIIFQPMDGSAIAAKNVTARPSLNGWRYTSENVSVDVIFRECSDGMSDTIYKDTVTVLVGTNEYRGCGGARTTDASLTNTRWEFVTLNGKQLQQQGGASDRRVPGITFSRDMVGIYGGCNGGGGIYVSGDGWLRTGPMMATQMACDPAIMAQEQAASSLIDNATWTVDGEGFLILESASSNARLRRAEMDQVTSESRIEPKWEDRRWNVASLNYEYQPFNAYGDTPFTLTFAGGRMFAKVGCNQLSGGYSIVGDVLEVGPMSATRMACAPELMARDRQFVGLMQSRPKFAMSPNRELLIGSKEGVMVLQGTRAADEPDK
jgi:heat shock protein HslJ